MAGSNDMPFVFGVHLLALSAAAAAAAAAAHDRIIIAFLLS